MNLQKIETRKDGETNGWLMPIYRDYDEHFQDYEIRFIYASSVSPHCKKGPHLHHKRQGRLVCIVGQVEVIWRVDGEYRHSTLNSDDPEIFHIPTGVPFEISNNTDSEAVVLNMADHAWKPDDQDSIEVKDWKP